MVGWSVSPYSTCEKLSQFDWSDLCRFVLLRFGPRACGLAEWQDRSVGCFNRFGTIVGEFVHADVDVALADG